MLIYHPAFDAYHCAFRMLSITSQRRVVEFAKLRILDFFLCFPAEVANVQLPQEHGDIKKLAREARNPYRGPISASRTFRDLEPIQSASARLLALTGVFSISELEQGQVVRTGQALPDELQRVSVGDFAFSSPLDRYVLSRMADIPLAGIGGLKQRTGLMEYRYDAI
jgi:hypothetical protein